MKTSPDLPNSLEFEHKLAFDICRCSPRANPCAEKDNCLRFLAPGRPEGWQAYFDFSERCEPNQGCIYMMRADL